MNHILRIFIFAILECLAIAASILLTVLALTVRNLELAESYILLIMFLAAFLFSFIPVLLGGGLLRWIRIAATSGTFQIFIWASGIIFGLSILIVFSFFRGSSELGGALDSQSIAFFTFPFMFSLFTWVYLAQKFLKD